jgi:hypothetical protein
MKKQIIIILFPLFLINGEANGQESSYKEQIQNFINDVRGESSLRFQPSVYIIHLFTDEDFNDKEKGIYKFGATGSHQKQYLLLFDGEDITFLDENLTPESALKDCLEFLSRHELNLSHYEKSIYLSNILEVIQYNIRPPGTWVIDND